MLRRRHFADREAHRTAEIVGATGPAHDVAKRPRGDDRSIPVRCRKPADQLAGDILLRAQDAVALERPGRDASGVCSHEGGRDGLDRAGGERKVEREMVPFHPKAPGRSSIGIAEDDPGVVVRVAIEPPHRLDRAEDRLEAHDVGRLAVARIAQHRAQERLGGGALAVVHRLER